MKFGSFFPLLFLPIIVRSGLKMQCQELSLFKCSRHVTQLLHPSDCSMRSANAIPPGLQLEMRKNSFTQSLASSPGSGGAQQVGSGIAVPRARGISQPHPCEGLPGSLGSGKAGKVFLSGGSSGIWDSELSR